MITVCLLIAGIVGVFCADGAPLVGDDCLIVSHTAYCITEAENLPIRASYYDPAAGGINCDHDCAYLADMTPTAEGYGIFAACPMGMYGRWLEVEHAGLWQCRDHGGDVVPKFGRWYTADGFVEQWVITVDFLLPLDNLPPWQLMILDWQYADGGTAVSLTPLAQSLIMKHDKAERIH